MPGLERTRRPKAPQYLNWCRALSVFDARSVAFDQRHFRPIDRNHHARGVGVDFSWDASHFIGLDKGVNCRSSSGVILISLG